MAYSVTFPAFSRRLFFSVLKEVGPLVLLAFLILTALIFAQQVGRQGDLLFGPAASVGLSLQIMACLLPGIVVITLPFALLIGTLMALSRLSADSELVAAKACGLSLFSLALPLLACGLLGTGVAAWMTLSVMPRAVSYGKQLGDLVVLQALAAPIKPRTFDTHFPGTLVYVRDVDRQTGEWVGVFLVRKLSERETLILTARRGRLRLSRQSPAALEAELLDGLAVQAADAEPQRQSVARFERQEIRLAENDPLLAGRAGRLRAVQELSLAQLARRSREAAAPPDRRQAAVEWHKRLVLPLACLCLTLMAVPFGARPARQAGRAVAFAVGFALAVAYYIVLLAGQNLALSGVLPASAGAWLANLAAVVAGLFMLTARPANLHWPAPAARTAPALAGGRRARAILRVSLAGKLPRVGSLINYLLLSETVKYFALALGVLLVTSLVFTLFDILPALMRSGLGLRYGAVYLAHLAPQIAYLTAPFALLLALLTAHGVLARSSQLTALLASGLSFARLGLPLLASTLLVIGGLFWLSDAVLPASNREQDARYHRIKGRQVEQAAVFAGQRWVGGSDGNTYSYQHLSHDNILLNATVYVFDPQTLQLREVLFAHEARPLPALRPPAWQIIHGWRYDLTNPFSVRYRTLVGDQDPAGRFTVPDGAALFTRTVNEAAKMSFADLQGYVRQLARTGAPTAALRVELEKKKAFPFSCLTLILTALPLLSLRTRRSALAGVGVSIVLGFAFWIASSLFEAAGKQSLLPPWLAAWGGQMIFLLLGTYLLLRHRTR